MKRKDDNERAQNETLPEDPFDDAVPFNVIPIQDKLWENALRHNQNGALTKDIGNVALILTNSVEWRGCLAYDQFTERCYWAQPAPVVPGMPQPVVGERFADHHATYVAHWFARTHHLTLGKGPILDAMVTAAQVNARHPLQDYLSSLVWDETDRINTWLTRYLGVADSEYSRNVGAWWLISAVARAMRPGCQADHMLVLEGAQGRRKSTALRILAGEWFLGSLPDLRDAQKAAERIQGKWICEVGELDALKGAAATKTKDWLTQPSDTFRPAYGRFSVDFPRSIVFAGTTNESNYLHDHTGARRYWPVEATDIDAEALKQDRDQLWAEATEMFRRGCPWWPGQDQQDSITQEQEERHDVDVWEQVIAPWIAARDDGFTTADILTGPLGIEPGKQTRGDQNRVGAILRRLEYSNHRRRVGECVQRIWIHPTQDPKLT